MKILFVLLFILKAFIGLSNVYAINNIHDNNYRDGGFQVIESLPILTFQQLTRGGDGYLYGAAYLNMHQQHSLGNIYRLSTDGSDYKIMHKFSMLNGINPNATLTIGPDGSLYGTTLRGGKYGFGTLFKLNIDGQFKKIHEFSRDEGANPATPLVLVNNKVLYGMTQNGGKNNYGTIYTIDSNESYKKIYDFDKVNGMAPDAATLLIGPNNSLYGTTIGGGKNGFGVIFKISLVDNSFIKLYDFPQVHPFNSYSGLLLGADGDLYGAMSNGGDESCGAIYKFNPNETNLTILYSFKPADGCHPYTNLEFDNSQQNIYGTTILGGVNNSGAVFKYNLNQNTLTNIHSFISSEDNPNGLTAVDNFMYGVTQFGVIFKLND